jgi:hypothetical protein
MPVGHSWNLYRSGVVKALVGVLSTDEGRLLYDDPKATLTPYVCQQGLMGCKMAPAKYGNQVKLASYYPPEMVETLKRLSDATRIPQAAYLREALEDLLKKHAAALRKAK